MFARAVPEALELFDRAAIYGQEFPTLNEQECIRDLILQDTNQTSTNSSLSWSDQHIKFIPQYKANAYPEEIKCLEEEDRPWRAGDFLIHFPGAKYHVPGTDAKGQMMRKYSGMVQNL